MTSPISDTCDLDIRAIAAVGKSGQIGLNGRLPWPSAHGDAKFFWSQIGQTFPEVAVAGRRTIEGLYLTKGDQDG